jgi:hypothetical protein
MKGILIKTEVNYLLKDDKDVVVIASTSLKKKGLSLSKENCDEIFGVVDVDRLFLETPHTVEDEKDYWKIRGGYIEGYNKAMELNKDKLFTEKDIEKAYGAGMQFIGEDKGSYGEFIQSLQQPTEIEVEIVTYVDLAATPVDSRHPDAYLGTNTGIPFLDENGCLILKRF